MANTRMLRTGKKSRPRTAVRLRRYRCAVCRTKHGSKKGDTPPYFCQRCCRLLAEFRYETFGGFTIEWEPGDGLAGLKRELKKRRAIDDAIRVAKREYFERLKQSREQASL